VGTRPLDVLVLVARLGVDTRELASELLADDDDA